MVAQRSAAKHPVRAETGRADTGGWARGLRGLQHHRMVWSVGRRTALVSRRRPRSNSGGVSIVRTDEGVRFRWSISRASERDPGEPGRRRARIFARGRLALPTQHAERWP